MKHHSLMACALGAALFTGVAMGAPISTPERPDYRAITPGELKWADVASMPPGAMVAVIEGSMSEAAPFTVRLKVPANYRIPAHRHPAAEHVTVISGTLYVVVGGSLDPKNALSLPAGSMIILEPNTPHFAWTREETVLQLHGTGPWGITYLDATEDPRRKK